jgi:hypothetical protein
MFSARINDRIRNDVAAECEQNNKACQQAESRYPKQTHYSDLLLSLPRSVKRRRLFIRTVVVAPTIENVLVLGLTVLIRTFLSLSLQLEIEGRLPLRREAQPRV